MKIVLVSIIVDDPIEAFKFYTDVLGFVKRIYVPEANLVIVASPEEPDGVGLLLEPKDSLIGKTFHEALYQSGLPAIVFGVANIQEETVRLKKLGVSFRQEPTQTEYGLVALFEDTCGNLIQIHQG